MKPTVVRPCGHLELFSTSRHNLGIYRGVANACQYVIAKDDLNGLSVQSAVENALARVILRLGGLRVAIFGEDTNQACFVEVLSMDLQDFVQWKTVAPTNLSAHDEQVLQLFRDRLEQLWPDIANRPPWKILVLEIDSADKDVIVLEILFAIHHSIGDGKSTSIFHTQFLRELNSKSGPPSELGQHILTFTKPPVMAPSQEELIPFKISWPFFLKLLWREILCPCWLKFTPTFEPWTGKPINLEPHTLCIRAVTINADQVSRLVSVSRAHGATLTAVVHVLVLASLARRVPADAAPAFSCETSISYRPWAKLPPGMDMDLDAVLADLATSSGKIWVPEVVARLRSALDDKQVTDEVEDKVIWPLAAEWRTEMKAKVASLPNDDPTGLLGYVSDWNKKWLDRIGKAREGTWEIANVGSMSGVSPGNDGSGWSIRRSLFAQPVKVVGSALSVGMSGIEGKDLTITLTWQDTIVEAAIVDGLVEDIGAWLDNFAVMGRFGIFEG